MTPMSRPEPRRRLGLFPLPVVLLPGTRMPLHIFEPRYRSLVRDCLAGDRRFGLIYHDWDREGPFLCDEGRIGCIAEIQEHEALPDGRSLISVAGMERFRICDGIESEALYFEGLIESVPDLPTPAGDDLDVHRRASLALFRKVAVSLQHPPDRVPDFAEGTELSYLLAQTIEVDPTWHQALLEQRDERVRLAELDRLFRAVLE